MLITLILIGLGVWIFYSGWRFYRHMDWDEPAEASPDFQQMHKRQAELLHIQDLLQQAHEVGKLSSALIEEFNRYCDREVQQMTSAENAWKNRRSSSAVH